MVKIKTWERLHKAAEIYWDQHSWVWVQTWWRASAWDWWKSSSLVHWEGEEWGQSAPGEHDTQASEVEEANKMSTYNSNNEIRKIHIRLEALQHQSWFILALNLYEIECHNRWCISLFCCLIWVDINIWAGFALHDYNLISEGKNSSLRDNVCILLNPIRYIL